MINSVKRLMNDVALLLEDSLKTELPNFFECMPLRYFKLFSAKDIADHYLTMTKLTPDKPCYIQFDLLAENRVQCFVFAYDTTSLLSMITGVFSAAGFDIDDGDIFTSQKLTPSKVFRRRLVVDSFTGTLDDEEIFQVWSESAENLLLGCLKEVEQGGRAALPKVQKKINHLISKKLEKMGPKKAEKLHPMSLSINNQHSDFTHLKISTQDTPMFLYSVTNALALQGIRIEQLKIRTVEQHVEDEFFITNNKGLKITEKTRLDQLKLAVLLTKQFTYFLDKAPQPYEALIRFETMISDLLNTHKKGQWKAFLSDPKALSELAKVLGASDYLWEDFIREQGEELMPVVQNQWQLELSKDLDHYLETELATAKTFSEKQTVINQFKDKEAFAIDLNQLLGRLKFNEFSSKLTRLAEAVISASCSIIYARLIEELGTPMAVAGLPTSWAVLGLGKFGGEALGYASDIELILVYSDSGKTDKKEISNHEFFSRMVQELYKFIRAKRDGIFQLDLRLRPYGNEGPLAVSLESFCRYYEPGGAAMDFERLALVRLRAVSGDSILGKRLQLLRDEYVYSGKLRPEKIWELRKKQYLEKLEPGKKNAKFSPGALVDIEYAIQALQVIHGKEKLSLRQAKLELALKQLAHIGFLEKNETKKLIKSYHFFRKLINALRMLRGSAKDLFLPVEKSEAYGHLARRMGYVSSGGLSPSQQLFVEFNTATALVRAFVQKWFKKSALPTLSGGNVVDILLSSGKAEQRYLDILRQRNFREPKIAFKNILSLAQHDMDCFLPLSVLALMSISERSDPDMTLNHWERFVSALSDKRAHFKLLLNQPSRLEMLFDVFSVSQFLAMTLIRFPKIFEKVTSEKNLRLKLNGPELERRLKRELKSCRTKVQRWAALRTFRRIEILKIVLKDISLKVSLRHVTRDLSLLAEVILTVVLDLAWEKVSQRGVSKKDWTVLKNNFCILALGKLGGSELNYSSDIDLIPIFDDGFLIDSDVSSDRAFKAYKDVTTFVLKELTHYTEEGAVYRVDFNLRPFGSSGSLISPLSKLVTYYERSASAWEIQALLKMRPVAGNWTVGFEFFNRIQHELFSFFKPDYLKASIKHLRKLAIKKYGLSQGGGFDIKSGQGGIRDIEFLVQGLQLIHSTQDHPLLARNSLDALKLLHDEGHLSRDETMKLRKHYIFFRRLEHFLQIMDDRQVHALPNNDAELGQLARRILGRDADKTELLEKIQKALDDVHKYFQRYI